MKINRIAFWIFSVSLALLSCYLFEVSSIGQLKDPDYLISLNLPSDADTPALAIAGAVILAYAAGAIHCIILTSVLIFLYVKRRRVTVKTLDFVPNFKAKGFLRILGPVLGYLVSAFWVWFLIQDTTVKFYGSSLLFTIVAIVLTWTYVVWIMNIGRNEGVRIGTLHNNI